MSGHADGGDRERLKQAVLKIRSLQEKVADLERVATEPVAVLGIGCRFPGEVRKPADFWQLLESGTDAITEVPGTRWNADEHFDADPSAAGKMYTKAGGFITEIDRFDAAFFGISNREAAKIDPQHRMLVEEAWAALEDAGIPPLSLVDTRTGVFIGITGFEYGNHLSACGLSAVDAYAMTGTKLNFAAGRIAYLLGLQGPALAIDTACSSSLVATHVAVRSLRLGDCDLALVGGVNAMLAPEQTIGECKSNMLSPDGRCNTFDASANGFVRGEGCGVVVLKRLRDALADEDPIRAVIAGSAINQDGPSSGLTVPNRVAQEAVIRQALADARLAPSDIDYIEAHGTGTPLGDPIEVRALANVFGKGRPGDRPLKIGSVKTNIGHLESAAGIAGLIKAVLTVENRVLPPSLNFTDPNPAVAWDEIPIAVVSELEPWPASDGPVRAGVSAFGASGTNAHIIVEAAPRRARPAEAPERAMQLLAISAKSEDALGRLVDRYIEELQDIPRGRFVDVCHTSTVGRSHLAHRLAVPAMSAQAARTALLEYRDNPDDAAVSRGLAPRTRRRVALLFSGQGAQYPGMGKVLYETQPLFRQLLDECSDLLLPHLDRALPDILFSTDNDAHLINETRYTQPALFALEYALARLWMAWGISPTALLGHSVGEIAAVCAAGMLELPDAARLIAARARLMGQLPAGGAMAAVFAPLSVVEAGIESVAGVGIAGVNAPTNIVISGAENKVRSVLDTLAEQGVESHQLEVSHAFHSHLLEPMLDEFENAIGGLSSSPGDIAVVSNLTGEPLTEADAGSPAYWRRHARNAVRFEAGMHKLASLGIDTFVEVGPGATLLGMGSQCLPVAEATWLPSIRPGRDDWHQLCDSVARSYALGIDIDWAQFDRGFTRRRLSLPTYEFARTRHWIDGPSSPPASRAQRQPVGLPLPLHGHRLASPLDAIQFETTISAGHFPWIRDHRIFGTTVLSATAYIEIILAAAREAIGDNVVIEDLFLHSPLTLAADAGRPLQLIFERDDPGYRFRCLSATDIDSGHSGWKQHVSGRLQVASGESTSANDAAAIDLADVESRCGQEVDVAETYAALAASGVDLGPSYRTVDRLLRGDGETLGWVRADIASLADAADHVLHPALLDGCLQVAREVLPAGANDARQAALIPQSFARVHLHRANAERVLVHASLRDQAANADAESFEIDVTVLDENLRLVAEVEGFRVVRVQSGAFATADNAADSGVLFEPAWRLQPLPESAMPDRGHDWIIFGSGDEFTAALTARIAEAGANFTVVMPGDDGEDFQQLLRNDSGRNEGVTNVVYARGIDAQDPDGDRSDELVQVQADVCRGLLRLVQALDKTAPSATLNLAIVTHRAQGTEPSQAGLAQSPLWGFGRVIASEMPALNSILIDTHGCGEDSAGQVIAELYAGDGEDQVRYDDAGRHVARLARLASSGDANQAAAADDPDGPRHLVLDTPGILDSLALRPVKRRAPGAGEVEIEVQVAGLNFRDVLVALGVYQGELGPLGGECAGRVVAVGAGVAGVEVGDEVMAFATGALASHVVTDAKLTWPVPPTVSIEQAAALPIAYLTAAYCLQEQAHIARGDRVLVHCAAGGVGMAAVQLARRRGAEVFGTAGSAQKRALIESNGVAHALDSRTLHFAEDIRRITGNEGVDVVLNSLAGEFIEKGLSVVREGGRFVEIGRTDTWSKDKVARTFPGVDYHTALLGDVCERDPDLIQSLGADILAAIECGDIEALPVTVFPIDEAADAFRLMAQGKHTGKLVLRMAAPGRTEKTRPMVRPDRSYLVTGGFGGLGLLTAKWLVAQGGRHIILTGRQGQTDEAAPAVDALRACGAEVTVLQGDIATQRHVDEISAHLQGSAYRLGGIVHAAGVVDDGVIAEQNWDRFSATLAPKVQGSWLLNALADENEPDFFIVYSSASALLGVPGQSSYASANAFLDALIQWRRSNGKVGLSVNWGPWADAGMFVDAGAASLRNARASGLQPLASESCFAAMAEAHALDRGQVAVIDADWRRASDSFGRGGSCAYLAELAGGAARRVEKSADDGFRQKLLAAPPRRRVALMRGRLRTEVARVLASESAAVATDVGFRELGMDSLLAVELRNRLEKLLGLSLVSTIAFDYPSIETLGEHLLREYFPAAVRAHDEPGDVPPDDPDVDDLRDMTDDAAEALLLAELQEIRGVENK